VTLLAPLVIDHDDMSARCCSQCDEVATQHDSELVLARQPERLTGFDDVQRPLRRPVELQHSTHGRVVDLDDHVAHDEEDVVEVTVRDHESVTVPRDPGNPGVLELSGEVKTDHRSSVPSAPDVSFVGVSEGYPPAMESSTPILPSRDLQETPAFYEALGFEDRGAPPDEWDYLIIGRGDIWLHFISMPDVDPLGTASSCYLYVNDADALYADWSSAVVPERRRVAASNHP